MNLLSEPALMDALLVAIVAVAAFAAVLKWSRVVSVAGNMTRTAASGVTAMLDSDLDDDAKERAVRQSSLKLLAQSLQVAWRIVLALAAVALPILFADAMGLAPWQQSVGVLLRVDFILLLSGIAVLFAWALGHRRKASGGRITDSSAYGAGDRLLHSLAFSGPSMLRSMAHLDDCLFARTIAEVPETPPVFITSLARGGTTALLNAMHQLPQVATHRYCDMPFISAPILWSKLAGSRRTVTERERAHGDGIKIGLQSPEAFDEIFWLLNWPEKYREQQIDLWHVEDTKKTAQEFFVRHFRKITKLRHPTSAPSDNSRVRYLSKNNTNIARLDLLPTMFPECDIIIALREPGAHAASLHRQHANFTKLHTEDEFVRRYMRDIGHLEFGALHRPIAFDAELLSTYHPEDPNYWLAYWVAAFEEASRHVERVFIVTQDDLRKSSQHVMHALMERLRLNERRVYDFEKHFLKSPDLQPEGLFNTGLLRRAGDVYNGLADYAVR